MEFAIYSMIPKHRGTFRFYGRIFFMDLCYCSIHLRICDGLARSGPSEEAAWADAATSDPEAATSTPNPRALPGWTGQRQEIRVPKIVKAGETPAGAVAEKGGI
ncbi:hypothetical protein NDU88_008328 [Pleurodeles waltl]|uniref:Uncharacterized protein n=1 Tax=Pleurodeles waltl TaxID=8319 RepID=A0AAV7VW54_PLEWA|nr:hypothetical protein NDU88_008328 [Pleurodeles waltl]